MAKHRILFDGGLLQRGYWVYMCRIVTANQLYIYVGRTGDSSSPNAASPFSRIGRHLDARPNATSNAMWRQLMHTGVDPMACKFEMVALGPLFRERKSMTAHRPIRDKVAAIERATVSFLQGRGYSVLGTHGRATHPDSALFAQVRSLVAKEFPPLTTRQLD